MVEDQTAFGDLSERKCNIVVQCSQNLPFASVHFVYLTCYAKIVTFSDPEWNLEKMKNAVKWSVMAVCIVLLGVMCWGFNGEINPHSFGGELLHLGILLWDGGRHYF